MRRTLYAIALFALLASLPTIIVAQNEPATTPDPSGGGAPAPTIAAATVAVPVAPTQQQPPSATQVPGIPTDVPAAATEAPPAASPFDGDVLPILINARTDMELLASQHLGNNRPPGWSGSLDINDPQLAILMRLDLELLVGTLVAPDKRPAGWFGAVPSSPYAIARDIRHDLELLADSLDQPNVRPPGWAGGDPLMRCDRSVQTLVNVLERGGVYTLSVDPANADFCKLAALQAARFAEINLLSKQAAPAAIAAVNGSSSGQTNSAAPAGSILVKTNFAVAFLNRSGSQRVGVIPQNEPIKPLGRSYVQFSHMVLVQGDKFEVFVDYQTTSLTEEQYIALPDINGVPASPACNAKWCEPVVNVR